MNNYDTTLKHLMRWHDKCIEKYGWVLLSLYNDNEKFNNYINNLNKLLNSIKNYENNVKLTDQQLHDLNVLFNNIEKILLNAKNMNNNIIKLQSINNLNGGVLDKKVKKSSKKKRSSKRSSKKILSPKRMYSTIAKGW